MKLTGIAVALGVAAVLTSVSSMAGDDRTEGGGKHGNDAGMQAIVDSSTIGQPGYRWRYFAIRESRLARG